MKMTLRDAEVEGMLRSQSLLLLHSNNVVSSGSSATSTPTFPSTKEEGICASCSTATTLQDNTAIMHQHCNNAVETKHPLNVTGTSSYTPLLQRFQGHKLNNYVLIM